MFQLGSWADASRIKWLFAVPVENVDHLRLPPSSENINFFFWIVHLIPLGYIDCCGENLSPVMYRSPKSLGSTKSLPQNQQTAVNWPAAAEAGNNGTIKSKISGTLSGNHKNKVGGGKQKKGSEKVWNCTKTSAANWGFEKTTVRLLLPTHGRERGQNAPRSILISSYSGYCFYFESRQ